MDVARRSRPRLPRVFISYRREDTTGHAGRLYDSLAARLGNERVFMDIDTISPGEDFTAVIDQAVRGADAMVVLIGPRWLSETGPSGRPRIGEADDFVRLEIKAALERGIPVVPVLVRGAGMPSSDDLPPDISPLARRQALQLSDERWQFDVARLLGAIGAGAGAARPGPDGGTPTRWRRRLIWAAPIVLLAAGAALAVRLLDRDGGQAAGSGGSEPVAYKTVTDRTGALKLSVPRGWEATDGTFYDLHGSGKNLGPGLVAGTDVHETGWSEPRAFLGASVLLAERLETAGAGTQAAVERLAAELEGIDWTLDDCVLDGEFDYERAPYHGVYRRWRGCGQLPGVSFWDLFAVPRDGAYVISVQIGIPDASYAEVAQRILNTFEVVEENLPRESSSDGDQVTP